MLQQGDRLSAYVSFVHISDIHFRGYQPIGWRERFEGWMECFPGLAGERWNRVTGLALAFAHLKKDSQETKLRLLVSGDFTAWGAEDQFQRAISFLEESITATGETDEKYNEPMGMMEADWRYWSVPGNHDHWSAPLQVLSFCDANTYCRSKFRSMPWADVIPLGESHALRVYFLDSDSEVWGSGNNIRPDLGRWARGRFIEQINTMIPAHDPDGVLKRIPPQNIANALVIHHSTSCDAYFLRTKKILSIDSETKNKLKKFCSEMNVSVVLTGHVHDPFIDRAFPASGASSKCLEARCGTTTQWLPDPGDRAGIGWWLWGKVRSGVGFLVSLFSENNPAPARKNSFLLHHIGKTHDNKIRWDIELWEYRDDRFVRSERYGFPKRITLFG